MKYTGILWIALVIFITNAKSQTEFAPLGAKWHYEMGWYTNGMEYRSFYKAESVRDTLLLEQLAKVIEFTFYDKYGDTVDWGEEILYGNDVKVHHYDKVNNEFYTLFDFTVSLA